MLTKIERVDKRRALYRCDCGNTKVLWMTNVKPGHTTSCGCYRKRVTALRSITHGHSTGYQRTKTYTCWKAMRQRCINPKVRSYVHYGARGIKVCPRWNSFENFLMDMGEAPEGMTLDRIDVDGGYEPDNCRWASRITQMNNRRNNRMVDHNGERHTLAEWARRTGVKYHTLMARLDIGMPVARALSFAGNLRRVPTNDASTGLVRLA